RHRAAVPQHHGRVRIGVLELISRTPLRRAPAGAAELACFVALSAPRDDTAPILERIQHLGACRHHRAHLVRRAVCTAWVNSAVMAAVMSSSVLTEKYSPGDAQLCMLAAIWGWNGLI